MTDRQFIPFARPDLDSSERVQVEEVLESGWLTTGPKTKEFEREFAQYVGAPHAVAVNSGTAALHLSLEAIGLKPGDEVVLPTYTFAATAEVVRYFDARPVLVDVDPRTLLIDPKRVEEAITPKTRALIPVHLGGLTADLDALSSLADRHKLPIIEDAAHALPSTHRKRRVGSFGDLCCFSFYATKTLTTGEGGMICTGNGEWADRCRQMSLHGISRDAWKRYTASGSWFYEIGAPGFKYNLTDLASALGLAQLRKVDRMWERRQAIAQRYTKAFAAFADSGLLETPAQAREGDQHSWHLYMLRLNLEALSIDRAAFIEQLRDRGIGASVHFIPLHLHPYYRETYGWSPDDFPVAYREYQREVSLPIYSKLSDAEVDEIIGAVAGIASKHKR